MALIISMLTFFTVTGLVLAYQQYYVSRSRLQTRLKRFSGREVQSEYVEKEGISKRVLGPAWANFSRRVSGWAPQHTRDRLRSQILMAGNPGGMQVSEFMALKMVLAGGLGALALWLPLPIWYPPLLGVLGWFLPSFLLKRRIAQRQKAIALALADVLDLLTVSVEAGLGFDSAVAKVVEKTKGPLAEEFMRMLQEIRMGKPRREALRNLSLRTGVPDLQGFVAAIIQADQLGVSIGKVLRIQSAELRRRRRQRAEEAAMKAPIKMLLPLVVFVFPSLFIVLLGPALLRFLAAF